MTKPSSTNDALFKVNLRSSHWLGSQVDAFCDLNKDPNSGWFETNSSVTKSFSPTLDIKTLYLSDEERTTKAYSPPPSR